MSLVSVNGFVLKDNSNHLTLGRSHTTSGFFWESRGNPFTFSESDHSSRDMAGYIVSHIHLSLRYNYTSISIMLGTLSCVNGGLFLSCM